MPKPSAVLSCVVIFLSIALIALVVSGLVVYLDKYKDFRDLGVWSALALSGFFTPLLGVPVSYYIFFAFCHLLICSVLGHMFRGGVCLPPHSIVVIVCF
jgi:uncharacterized membrane protein (DUF441 family)